MDKKTYIGNMLAHCDWERGRDSTLFVHAERIEAINKLCDEGHTIKYFARGMGRFGEI